MSKIKSSQAIHCPICFSRATAWEKLTSTTNKKVFPTYKCTFCGHGFIYPGVKNKQALSVYYNQDYAQDYSPDVKSPSFQLRKKQYYLDVALIKKYLSTKRVSVLDFGCSMAQFLNAMPKNWKKYGFEINQSELDYVSKNYKQIILFSTLSQVKKQRYDLITLRGVIEHLFDFKELFSVLSQSLKPGGVVYICATPDFSSPAATVYRTQWNQICPPLHYHQFTPASAAILFAKNNFGLEVLAHPYLDTPYAKPKTDLKKFIANTKQAVKGQAVNINDHAYPGTMMSLIFRKIK